jgi:hypothetical protein
MPDCIRECKQPWLDDCLQSCIHECAELNDARRREPVFGTKRPTKPEMVSIVDAVEVALASIVHRWDDGVAPELRDEVNTKARLPLLAILIAMEVRGVSRAYGARIIR